MLTLRIEHGLDDPTRRLLSRLIRVLDGPQEDPQLLEKVNKIMATLDEVLAKITEQTSLDQSISELIDGVLAERDSLKAQVEDLKAQLEAAGVDTAKVQAILDALNNEDSILNATKDKLVGAVVTNTSAEPAPEPTPVEEPPPEEPIA